MNYCTPPEIAQNCMEAQVKRATMPAGKLFILGILAGCFIAFGAEGSTMAAHDLTSLGAGWQRFITGSVFSVGLMYVIICGAELFTGNVLMLTALFSRKISFYDVMRNWTIVLLGNMVGGILVAWLMYMTGLFKFNNNLLGAATLATAVAKVNLTWGEVFFRGILCNWLVGLAVWMSFSSKDIISKVATCYLPVMTFVMSGFEHSVANMYYIPAGLFAKTMPAVVEASKLGVKIDTLTIETTIMNNWIPAVLGNIVGLGIFVAMFYWYSYMRTTSSVGCTSGVLAAMKK
ncbi:formate/nitrite transporter family protein [Sporomusa sp. KB1]|jgi:formate/nitrite transporter|uniref:formate/nitrite transporter family protein n=1 Tax=Sporomusa sp. KB1 TaxID=943346 RepID=UPI0011A0899B|nr:formate/nitrite transporter family protein [Sporomusa sp. KB1]TWH46508.1 formate/nitrite transporter [Sporomusa sp. KB1]